MVTEPTSNDRVVHHWLVGLVLKVRLPAILEVRGRPSLELLQLLGSRPDLDAGVDTVGGEGASSLDVPFIEHTWHAVSIHVGKSD